ncbi:hypothetical protein [Ralstonia phage phiRSL1]|uniref:CRIB domain-containing protein n=1 Tax=Ralstonia phage phiRSL1 TaxID=1980924 RepID=B2ZYI2_9CAUD|nr:hypothetical protein RSL1_ORF201 [Ralstonia phage phiRSL1]BAG41650.1 hypothetical protein [Ralstonia phage phiRSL1]
MGYTVADRLEVTILIDGVEFPLDTLNFLHMLHIGCSTRTRVPTCRFVIGDARHAMDAFNLQDGIPLTITLRALGGDQRTYSFRKFNHKKSFNGECFVYDVDGYWDSPLYWAGTSTTSIRGTSDEVLKQIAATCGLKYDGVSTTDSQLWTPRNRSYAEFVKAVVARGYVNNTSYMVAGLGLDGVLRYRNVNQLPKSKLQVTLGQIVPGSYVAMDYQPVAASGMSNKMQGYQHTRYGQSLVNPQATDSWSQLTYVPDVTSPMLNQTISQKIVSGYRSYGGLDIGNTHPAYEQARYQNQRFAALYNTAVEFLMLTPTTFNLFDKFTFAVDAENQKSDTAYAGEYTIAAQALFVQGASFGEKILGVRQGTNMQYKSA